MNERTVAAAELYAEMGLSESTIAQLEELTNQEQQSNHAESPDDAFGELRSQHGELHHPQEEIEDPSDVEDETEIIRPLCNHLFAQTPSRPARLCASR